MSLRFDARCWCAGCGAAIEDFGAVLKDGGLRLEEATVEGGKEVTAQVARACPFCLSHRVRIRATAFVGGRAGPGKAPA